MELSKQVCSLELAKRLKELGVKQESYWLWVVDVDGREPYLIKRPQTKLEEQSSLVLQYPTLHSWYSAFTVAELGEMLPQSVREWQERVYKMQCYKSAEGWRVEYWNGKNGTRDFRVGPDCFAHTEADARAKMLIYLLENGLLVKDV